MQDNQSRQLSGITSVQTIVHQTCYFEQHTVTRHPILHVFPTHTHHVHHDIYEHYCEFPCSESEEICQQTINCCQAPMTTGEV
ncbi:MAG: hypothetical protein JWN30_1582 [Bacilli bacterium]|nr:hypothetical protein [Bacilli bacterium]